MHTRVKEGHRRMHVELPRELYRALKIESAATERPTSAIVIDALLRYFAISPARPRLTHASHVVDTTATATARKPPRGAVNGPGARRPLFAGVRRP